MSDCAIDSSGSALVYNIITSVSVPPFNSSRDTSLGTALDIPITLSLDVPSGIIGCPPNSSPKALVSQEWCWRRCCFPWGGSKKLFQFY